MSSLNLNELTVRFIKHETSLTTLKGRHLRVQEIYSKNLILLRWSGAHWSKLFSTGENEKIQMMLIILLETS